MKTLFLGLGSSVLTDDSIGLFVVRRVAELTAGREGVEIVENEEGGFSLLDEALGCDRLVVIDSIILGDELGTLTRFGLADLERSIHSCTPHGANLATVLEFGRMQGLDVPDETTIFAIEVADVLSFGERPTPAL
ncbi:hydrogenase maturation protease, partial [bacterium]|nr:hydrogenase maturation protease [bacterium]